MKIIYGALRQDIILKVRIIITRQPVEVNHHVRPFQIIN